MQQAHMSTDEFDVANDGYPYSAQSDYYHTYTENTGDEQKDAQVGSVSDADGTQGFFSLMVRVLDTPGDTVMAARQYFLHDIPQRLKHLAYAQTKH